MCFDTARPSFPRGRTTFKNLAVPLDVLPLPDTPNTYGSSHDKGQGYHDNTLLPNNDSSNRPSSLDREIA